MRPCVLFGIFEGLIIFGSVWKLIRFFSRVCFLKNYVEIWVLFELGKFALRRLLRLWRFGVLKCVHFCILFMFTENDQICKVFEILEYVNLKFELKWSNVDFRNWTIWSLLKFEFCFNVYEMSRFVSRMTRQNIWICNLGLNAQIWLFFPCLNVGQFEFAKRICFVWK